MMSTIQTSTTATQAPVVRPLQLNQSELNQLKKISLDPKFQAILGCGNQEEAEKRLVSESSVEQIADGKRAVITPLTTKAFEEVRAASQKYQAEIFAKVDYQITEDGNSVVFTNLNSLPDPSHVLHIQHTGSKPLGDISKIMSVVGYSTDSLYQTVDNHYAQSQERAKAKPAHQYSKKIASYGPKLRDILLDLYTTSPDQGTFTKRYDALGIGPLNYGPSTKEFRAESGKIVFDNLEMFSQESIRQFLGEKSVSELNATERLELTERILTHPWRVISSHSSASTTQYEQDIISSSNGVTIHSHPIGNYNLPATIKDSEWLAGSWNKDKLEELWNKDRFQKVLQRSIQEIDQSYKEATLIGSLLTQLKAKGVTKESISELLDSKLIPEEHAKTVAHALRSGEPEQRVDGVIRSCAIIAENSLKRANLVREFAAKLISCEDFKTACELVDSLSITPDSESVFRPSPADKNAFSTIGRVHFPDKTTQSVNFIVNCLGESTISHDEKSGTYTIRRTGLYNDRIYNTERRTGNDFGDGFKIIGSTRNVIHHEASVFICEIGDNAESVLIKNPVSGKIALAFPEHSSEGKDSLGRINLLSRFAPDRFSFTTVTSHGEVFQVLDISNLGGLNGEDISKISAIAKDGEERKEMILAWNVLSLLRADSTSDFTYWDLPTQQIAALRAMIDAAPDDHKLYGETMKRVMKLDLPASEKRNVLYYINSELTVNKTSLDLPVRKRIDLAVEKGVKLAKETANYHRENDWWV